MASEEPAVERDGVFCWRYGSLEASLGPKLQFLYQRETSHVLVLPHPLASPAGCSWRSSASLPMARNCLSTPTCTLLPAAATGWWDPTGEEMGLE
jgi:hypothetical protein